MIQTLDSFNKVQDLHHKLKSHILDRSHVNVYIHYFSNILSTDNFFFIFKKWQIIIG